MLYLRQSTASQSVLIGPFLDSTDGNTSETGLTINASDIRLSKNGANIVAKNSGGGTHDELGYYTITLDDTDTDTVGRLQLMVHVAGALAVYHEFQVLEETVFDAMFASSAGLSVAVGSIANNAITAAAIASDAVTEIQSGLATAAALSDVDTVVDAILVDTAEIGTAGAGLTAIPWNASWDAEVQSEVTDALNAYDPPTHAELVSEINTVQSDIAALNNLSAAEVNAEVLDVLTVDAFAQPGQGAPPASTNLRDMLAYLYKAWRNRTTQTANEYALYADDGTTKDQEAAVSDDGTTFIRAEVTTGA